MIGEPPGGRQWALTFGMILLHADRENAPVPAWRPRGAGPRGAQGQGPPARLLTGAPTPNLQLTENQ